MKVGLFGFQAPDPAFACPLTAIPEWLSLCWHSCQVAAPCWSRRLECCDFERHVLRNCDSPKVVCLLKRLRLERECLYACSALRRELLLAPHLAVCADPGLAAVGDEPEENGRG